VSSAAFVSQDLRIDTFSIIANLHLQLLFVVQNFGFDSPRVSVAESITQSFGSNPVHFIPGDCVQVPRLAFNMEVNYGTILICLIAC